MEIVIKISNETYKSFIDEWTGTTKILHAVRHGTPLPEHHGRLIDADNMLERLHSENGMPRTRNEEYAWDFAVELFKKAPTIIEADAEVDADEKEEN